MALRKPKVVVYAQDPADLASADAASALLVMEMFFAAKVCIGTSFERELEGAMCAVVLLPRASKMDPLKVPLPSGVQAILVGSRRERRALERAGKLQGGFSWVDRVEPPSALAREVGALRIDHLFGQCRAAIGVLGHLWPAYGWFPEYLTRSFAPSPALPFRSVVEGALHVGRTDVQVQTAWKKVLAGCTGPHPTAWEFLRAVLFLTMFRNLLSGWAIRRCLARYNVDKRTVRGYSQHYAGCSPKELKELGAEELLALIERIAEEAFGFLLSAAEVARRKVGSHGQVR